MTNQDWPQLTEADIETMYANKRYHAIETARQRGQLAGILGHAEPVPTTGQISTAAVQELYAQKRYQEIDAARQRGQLEDAYTGNEAPPKPVLNADEQATVYQQIADLEAAKIQVLQDRIEQLNAEFAPTEGN